MATKSTIIKYEAAHYGPNTWGWQGRCAYCAETAEYSRKTKIRKGYRYTSLCAKHAKKDKLS